MMSPQLNIWTFYKRAECIEHVRVAVLQHGAYIAVTIWAVSGGGQIW